MDALEQFLRSLVASDPVAVGAVALVIAGLVWGGIELIDAWVKSNQKERGVPAEQRGIPGIVKWWIAFIAPWVLSFGSYLALQSYAQQPFTILGFALAGAAGYAASQLVHQMLEGRHRRESPA